MSSYKIDQVALQLYSLRDFCKTESDLRQTAEKVRGIGYKSVQYSGGGVPHAEAKAIFDAAGLSVCATHEPSDLILREPEAVSARLRLIGTRHTAYPNPAGVDLADEAAVRGLAKQLDAAGAVLTRHGQTLSYHNHATEFIRFGESTVLDFLARATEPAHLKFELDTYWIQYGGGDPARWLEALPGRVPLLHLKDYIFTKENKPVFGEIGRGVLDWRRILDAAENSGTEWLIVEQDVCPGDPFESVRVSFGYLERLLS